MSKFGLDNLEVLEIKQTGDLVKDVDKADLDSNYFLEALGLRSVGNQYVAQRDFGTKNRFHCPPIRPNAHIAITGATNATPIVLSVLTTDGIQAGDTIYVDEVVGNTGANGTWVVGTVVANTSIQLVGSVGNGAYSSGGIWCSPDTNTARPPVTIINGHTFYDKETQTEYEIIVGLDASSNTRIYVYDTGSTEASKWIELTRKFNCLIDEGAGIGANDTAFSVDTITENGVAYTPVADWVNNWIVVNTTSGQNNETVFITTSGTVVLTTDTVVGSNGLGWANNDTLELYRFPAIKFNYTLDNGATPSFDWMPVEQQGKVAMLYTNSATPKVARQPIQIMKRAARNYFYTAFGGSPQQTLPAGWYVESDYGIPNPFYGQEGTIQTPYSTFDANVHLVSGATNATPIVVTLSSVTGLSNGDVVSIVGVTGNTATNGVWTLANGAGFTFELANSVGNGAFVGAGTLEKVVTNNVYDKTSGRQWMNIYTAKKTGGVVATLDKDLRLYATVGYSNYEESDVVFQGFYRATTGAQVEFSVGINFALMNKEITSINFYGASANATIVAAGWAEATSEAYLISTVKTQTDSQKDSFTNTEYNNWRLSSKPILYTPYFGWNYPQVNGGENSVLQIAIDSGLMNLNNALNHAVDKNRSYPTPTFTTKGTREQGSIVAINEGNTKLHLSLYDGYGVHQDDNFPDVAVDNNGNKMLIEMFGSSELLGLEILYDTIFAFRNNLIETFDLQGVAKRSYMADIVSAKSIIATPYGVVFAGKAAIYIVPSDGGEIRVLNELWNNYYGGNEYVTGSTQYITEAYRSAIIAGYDDTYREANFLIQVNTGVATSEYILERYSFEDQKWKQRKLNTTDTIKYFTKRQNDGTFTIGLSKGLLKYPNRIGSYQWEDDVRINFDATLEISQSKAVPFTFTLNIARFNSQIIENVLHGFIVNLTGESTGGWGLMKVEFFANRETVAFDTQYLRVDQKMDYRTIERRGNIENLKIKFTMPDNSIFKKFDVSKITLGFISGTKLGNL